MKKTRCLFNTQKRVLLSRSEKAEYAVFMEAITKDDERKIDEQNNTKGVFSFKTLKGNIINNNNTYLYGSINLNSKKDIDYLLKFGKAILNPYDYHNWYYTSFDYETGIITYNENRGSYLGINFISDVIKWFKFHYCILGKPERVIIYKQKNKKLIGND